MAPDNLLLEGVELMLYGMGSVFVFLTLLVFSIRAMANILQRFAPAAQPKALPAAATPHAQQLPSADVLEAIQVAINQHRARRG